MKHIYKSLRPGSDEMRCVSATAVDQRGGAPGRRADVACDHVASAPYMREHRFGATLRVRCVHENAALWRLLKQIESTRGIKMIELGEGPSRLGARVVVKDGRVCCGAVSGEAVKEDAGLVSRMVTSRLSSNTCPISWVVSCRSIGEFVASFDVVHFEPALRALAPARAPELENMEGTIMRKPNRSAQETVTYTDAEVSSPEKFDAGFERESTRPNQPDLGEGPLLWRLRQRLRRLKASFK